MWTTNKLKKAFHDYFERNGHVTLPSSNVIPDNDPTLLFSNSGMVQFKNIFIGEKPAHLRVNTNQHCIRAGGKHNDLDDVGKDNYHHTFFEMLGNWSFGDYFKEDAIRFAYEFLVDELKIDSTRLYVTVYDEMDKDSRGIWRKYLPDERILGASRKDNFWEMGEFGPCGPCTEIHYDRIGGRDASHLVNMDDPNVLEIWNVVFMEFNNTPKGLVELDVKKIDTGIGLERLLSVLMGVKSNYLIDSFAEIIGYIETMCDYKYTDREDNMPDMAFRVLADHSRTIAICINDGVAFSNEGAGYVLRRILRRAVRYADDILKIETGKLSQIVKKASEVMGLEIDVAVVDIEEGMFKRTLKRGLDMLTKIIEQKGELNSADVFLLFDTYGFPSDLTKILCDEKGIKCDFADFDNLVEEAKERSRSKKETPITLDFTTNNTDDSFKYTTNGVKATLESVIYENEFVQTLEPNEKGYLVFDKTCFYSEAGGQVGDRGVIDFYDGDKKVGYFTVTDTKKLRGHVLHAGYLNGQISKTATLIFDEVLRAKTRANHSACHILGGFLRDFVPDAEQKGSYVDEFKFTYDFNSKPLSENVIDELETKMNNFISTGAGVSVFTMESDKLEEKGILYMKNIKYPEQVRIINMKNGDVELNEVCGGTHVSNTNEINKVVILSEAGISAGLRRITCVTNRVADEIIANAAELYDQLKGGEPITVDGNISVRDRKKIEEINKKLIKQRGKKIDEEVATISDDIKAAMIAFKLKNTNIENSGKAVFVHLVDFSIELNKKEMTKAIQTLGLLLKNENVHGIIYSKLGDECYIACLTDNSENVIASTQGKLRLSNTLVQGTVKHDLFDGFISTIQ